MEIVIITVAVFALIGFIVGKIIDHSILRGISNNIVILNDFNCCPQATQVEIAKCYFPVWASVLCTIVIVTLDESKLTGTIIDDLIKRYGCSYT